MRRKHRLKTLTAVQAAALALLAIFGAFTAQGSNAKTCKSDLSGAGASACYVALDQTH